jgi:hypothetical protein
MTHRVVVVQNDALSESGAYPAKPGGCPAAGYRPTLGFAPGRNHLQTRNAGCVVVPHGAEGGSRWTLSSSTLRT